MPLFIYIYHAQLQSTLGRQPLQLIPSSPFHFEIERSRLDIKQVVKLFKN
jgi:hypothetical protein